MASQVAKSETAKKAEVVKEIHQLKIKIINLEREKRAHIFNKHGDFSKDFTSMKEMEEKLDSERKTQRIQVVQQLSKIKNAVKKFQRQLKDIKPTPEFLEKIKGVMEDIEAQISTLKENQRSQFEELLRDERTTSQEVTALEKRIEMWSQAPLVLASKQSNRTTAQVASHRDITKDLPPEIASFERFVQQHGGIRGGWDDFDHSTFLKHRNRLKGRANFVKEVVGFLPTKTEDEIQEHELWYVEYMRLNDRKKEAIKKWKEKKENEEEVNKNPKELDAEEEKERLKQEAKQKLIEKERRERRANLNAWKVEQELKRAEEEERKLRQQLMKAKDTEKERERQMKIKAQVDIYRKQRESEELQRQYEEEQIKLIQKENNAYGREIVARFQERDRERLAEKLLQEEMKKVKAQEKEHRLKMRKQQIDSAVQRDPTRLYKLTEGWQERQKDKTRSSNGPLSINHIPQRAQPSWRQGLH